MHLSSMHFPTFHLGCIQGFQPLKKSVFSLDHIIFSLYYTLPSSVPSIKACFYFPAVPLPRNFSVRESHKLKNPRQGSHLGTSTTQQQINNISHFSTFLYPTSLGCRDKKKASQCPICYGESKLEKFSIQGLNVWYTTRTPR